MNTLTAIEAERVNQILKHAIDRLQILSYIPASWDDDIVVDMKCQPVLSSLERLWMCEEQLKELDASLSAAAAANGETGSGGGGVGVKDINILKQLHRICRATCRNFIADRPSLQTIMSRPELQSEDFSKFIRYLNELRSQIMSKLTTTVEDEAANRTLLHDLTERERHYEESRDVLQTKLNELRHEREHVSAGLDQTLRKLQHELHEITQVCSSIRVLLSLTPAGFFCS
jgi:septal ring factor EnvC (AmiA/AmiB activator)